jgi:hypothetical protein
VVSDSDPDLVDDAATDDWVSYTGGDFGLAFRALTKFDTAGPAVGERLSDRLGGTDFSVPPALPTIYQNEPPNNTLMARGGNYQGGWYPLWWTAVHRWDVAGGLRYVD